jgi:hypothetical protein
MKRFVKKSVLRFAGAMAACALIMPSMALASSWGIVGSQHVLDSPNLGFTFTDFFSGGVTSSCTRSSFAVNVATAQNLEITTATFGGLCTWTGPVIGDCTATTVGTRFPWTATAVTTSNIQIHGVFVDVTFANVPGVPGSCGPILNQAIAYTGTLSGGKWTGNSLHSLDFSGSEGLIMHAPGPVLFGPRPITLRGWITDTQTSLVVN